MKVSGTESEFLETVVAGNFDIASGILSAVDPGLQMSMNRYGEYEYGWSAVDKSKLAQLEQVSIMSDSSPDESQIAEQLFGSGEGVKYQDTVGYYHSLIAGAVTDDATRANSSSGGLSTWILLALLKRGLIDGVIHAKATEGQPGKLFEYGISRTEAEILAGAKTRYFPLELSGVLETIRREQGRFAVVAIPSFAAELRLLCSNLPEFQERIPYVIGLICGHQKSAHYTYSLARQYGIAPENLQTVNYRVKGTDKPANYYDICFTTADGRDVSIPNNLFFTGDWGHGFFKQKFSDFTDDALNETADIALGDAWLPEYAKDSGGTNIAIVRNPVLAEIVRQGVESGEIRIDHLAPERVMASQSGLIRHTRIELPYRVAKLERSGSWVPQKRVRDGGTYNFARRRIQDLRVRIRESSRTNYVVDGGAVEWKRFVRRTRRYVIQYTLIYRLSTIRNLSARRVINKVKAIVAVRYGGRK